MYQSTSRSAAGVSAGASSTAAAPEAAGANVNPPVWAPSLNPPAAGAGALDGVAPNVVTVDPNRNPPVVLFAGAKPGAPPGAGAAAGWSVEPKSAAAGLAALAA